MIACWLFLGIPEFPFSLWLGVEIMVEFVLIFDFLLWFVLKFGFPDIWPDLWLLHDPYWYTPLGLTICISGIIPTSFIAKTIIGNSNTIHSFGIACLWIIKLFKYWEFSKIVSNYMLSDQDRHYGISSSLIVWYGLLMATHVIGCVWLIVGWLDWNRNNWFVMDNFNQNPTNLERYVESSFFIVATMTGLGYGNVVP